MKKAIIFTVAIMLILSMFTLNVTAEAPYDTYTYSYSGNVQISPAAYEPELKTVDFEPEFAGKLSFYLSAVDGELKSDLDNPTLGLLLCKGKDKVVAEYALQDINKPIGISEYRVSDKMNPAIMENLPSIEDIENRIKL